MANIAAITVTGVLRKPITQQGILQGQLLYFCLIEGMSVILLSDEKDTKELEHWLMVEGMNRHNKIVPTDSITDRLPPAERRLRQLNSLRGQGAISFVIDADPETCANLVNNGYNTLTFTHANYSLPSWRPDYESGPTPWDSLVATVNYSNTMRALDKRNEEDPH